MALTGQARSNGWWAVSRQVAPSRPMDPRLGIPEARRCRINLVIAFTIPGLVEAISRPGPGESHNSFAGSALQTLEQPASFYFLILALAFHFSWSVSWILVSFFCPPYLRLALSLLIFLFVIHPTLHIHTNKQTNKQTNNLLSASCRRRERLPCLWLLDYSYTT